MPPPSSPSPPAYLLEALQLYLDRFGPLESEIDLKATVGALLSVMDEGAVAAADMETVIAQVITIFNQKQSLKPALEQLVERAKTHLKQREDDLTSIVSSYVQQFAPQIDQTELVEVVHTAISVLGDRKISASEAKGLTARVLKSFDLDLALRRWVPPELVTIARQIATYRQHGDIEATLMSVIQAYIQKFGALLSPELIRQILEQGSGNYDPRALLNGDLTSISDTIFLRFQLRKAAPKVTKSAEAMADQVHNSIQAFRHRRHRDRGESDVTRPIELGDLEVGSTLVVENHEEL
jgi:hypothetical protein